MDDLYVAFAALPSPSASEAGVLRYETLPISSGSPHLFAKTEVGNACLLLATSYGALPPPIQLEYLSVQHGVQGIVHATSSVADTRFTLVTLKRLEEPLVRAFLRFAVFLSGQLGPQPQPQDVADGVRRFVSLLQQLRKPSTRTIQGLWAELFLLLQHDDKELWIRGWHADPEDRHDFNLGGVRIEVKSSSSRMRKHHFTHEQLSAPRNAALWIASVLMERSGTGLSVFDLAQTLHNELSIAASMTLDDMLTRTLGIDFEKASEIKYDLSHARDSLLFFPLSRIPTLVGAIPDQITELSYSIQLNDVDGQRDLHFA
jgi:hypothetical protein